MKHSGDLLTSSFPVRLDLLILIARIDIDGSCVSRGLECLREAMRVATLGSMKTDAEPLILGHAGDPHGYTAQRCDRGTCDGCRCPPGGSMRVWCLHGRCDDIIVQFRTVCRRCCPLAFTDTFGAAVTGGDNHREGDELDLYQDVDLESEFKTAVYSFLAQSPAENCMSIQDES